MNSLIHLYNSFFPNTQLADWFFALLGLLVHVLVKLRHLKVSTINWKVFFKDYTTVWLISAITVIICLGTLPLVYPSYNTLDSALIGYSSSSLFKQLLKTRFNSELPIKSGES
jgi:hypothetical protein